MNMYKCHLHLPLTSTLMTMFNHGKYLLEIAMNAKKSVAFRNSVGRQKSYLTIQNVIYSNDMI